MIVTLDGRRLDDSFAADCTMDAVIEQVRGTHLGGRLLVSVAVDGHNLTDEELREGLPQPVADDAQLDLESAERTDIVRDALRGLAAEFEAAADGHVQIADRLSAGDVAGGLKDVGEFIQLWQTCYRTLTQCCELAGEDLTRREHAGRGMKDYLKELVTKLNELRNALDARDMVLLADLLRYELPPLCRTWQELLTDVSGQATPVAVQS
jgi:hypothetical protein